MAKETKSAVEILYGDMSKSPELLDMINSAQINADVAKLIHDARIQANLTQQQLADLVGTTQPVIARLEDADYDGYSLEMLQRIGVALNKRLGIRFLDKEVPPIVDRDIVE